MSRQNAATIFLTVALAASAAADVTRTPVAVPVTPDLVVYSVTVQRLAILADGSHQVRITATAMCNAVAPTSCGPFKLLADWWDLDPRIPDDALVFTDHPIPSTRLGEAGVTSLACGRGASARVPTAVRTFEATVPAGAVRVFRVTADSAAQVIESNELNNFKAERYRATATCTEADLVLTRVELIRSGGGAVVHVWVRNRCADACVADLYYTVGDIVQMIGTGLTGDTEAGPLGNVLAGGRAGEDLTLTVGVEARGGTCPGTGLTTPAAPRSAPARRRARCAATPDAARIQEEAGPRWGRGVDGVRRFYSTMNDCSSTGVVAIR